MSLANAFVLPSASKIWRVTGEGSFCSRNHSATSTVRTRSEVKVTMALNAKNLMKNKKGGKKKGKGKSSEKSSRSGTARSGNVTVDTNKREYIYQMREVNKFIGSSGKQILKNINLAYFPGAKIGIVGENGSGKSTLLNIIAGVDDDFDGIAVPQSGISLGYLKQEPELVPGTVKDNIDVAVASVKKLLERYAELGVAIANENISDEEKDKIASEWSRLQDEIEAKNGWELDRNVDRAMEALRCPPGDADVTNLSGGERRRVALCALLLTNPDMILFDEPTNHLDAESVLWLEKFLEKYTGTVLCITHDRYFLENLTDWILELDNGHAYPYKGNYSTYLETKAKRLSEEEKTESSRNRLIKQELEWMRSNAKGRQTKSKARISRYEDMLYERDEAQANKRSKMNQIYIPPGPKLGDIVVEAENVRKGFGENVLFENLTFSLPRGGIMGVVGANGSGKTTLLRMILGDEKPDAGTLRVGETVKLMYNSQERDAVNRELSVFKAIAGEGEEITLGKRTVNARAYLGWFNFKGSDQQKKVSVLSGGELNRLSMAQVTKAGGNLLLADEITNDADTALIRNMEEAILGFAGCAVIVSHDRAFLDRISTHILAFEGDLVPGQVRFLEGNFSAYLEDKKKRFGDTTPSRNKFAKLPVM